MSINDLIFVIIFFSPAAIANASASILTKLPILKNLFRYPLDFRQTYKGERLIGDHKTFGGLFLATCAALVTGILISIIYGNSEAFREISQVNYLEYKFILMSALMGSGAIIGDVAESMLKRRAGIPQGKSWFPFDQTDFIIGATLVSLLFVQFTLLFYVIIFIFFFLVHLIAKVIGFLLGIDKSYI